ncbi:MAG: hypothetical protein A4E24_01283 [Methanomethylovorans sp. PtaU1.Bin093]|jgi:hypothetical protein|uniref:hypothetical protein n=1 Tax=Methanomethylovorans sp. PtaU1.Bin093 TaxID=1811679 RepID=UPI0009C78540|nr:hypothetical protein [Methanomethylovorans sp. PtaU1.Bin093]OPY20357.1 MAG: hypothetical protein A4E24_01283 [Methanomethylovorans sp. PtaU1.Bin093]
MKKQLSLVLIFVVLFMGFSGCIFKGNENITTPSSGQVAPMENVSELVVLKNIPSGYSFIDIMPPSETLNGEFSNVENVVEAAIGSYQANESARVQYHVTAVKFSDAVSAESFLTNYKTTFKVLSNNETFQQVEFNGHEATQVLSYSVDGGKNVPRYKYFWNNENFVFIIEGNSEDPAVGLDFAKAIGY